MNQEAIRASLEELFDERIRQEEKWGEQNHDATTWLTILLEEVGELAEAMLYEKFGEAKAGDVRNEAIQVGAVAAQIVEWCDRPKAPTPPASPVDEGAVVKEFRERFVAQFIDVDQTSTDNLNQIEFWEVPTDKQIEAFIQNIIDAALTRGRS